MIQNWDQQLKHTMNWKITMVERSTSRLKEQESIPNVLYFVFMQQQLSLTSPNYLSIS